MKTRIHWLIRSHVIYVQFVGDITLRDIDSMALVVDWMLETKCRRPVYVILDTRYVRHTPRPVEAMRYLRNNFVNFDMIEKILHLSIETPTQKLTDIVAKTFRFNWQPCHSYHAVYHNLIQIDALVASLPTKNPFHLPIVPA